MTTTTTTPNDDPPSRALLRCIYGRPARFVTAEGSELAICANFDAATKEFLLLSPNTHKPIGKLPLAKLQKIIFRGRDLTPDCHLWNEAEDPNEGKIV